MCQIDRIKEYIVSDCLNILEHIEPFPEVVDALSETLECFYFTLEHFDSMPAIVFYGNDADDEDDDELLPSCLPRIFLQLRDPNRASFMFRIDFPLGDANCVVMEHMKAFLSMVFSCHITPCIYTGMQSFMVVLETDILSSSRLITYFLQLMGFRTPGGIYVNKSMDVSRGDMSLAVFPEDLSIPATFIRAFAKIKEMDIEDGDTIYLRLSNPNPVKVEETIAIEVWKEDGDWYFSEQQSVGDREAFLYPNIRLGDIVTSIARVQDGDDDEISVTEFFFYPDGSEDPSEKFEELITALRD